MLQLHSQNVQLCLIYSLFAMLHGKYGIITLVYLQWEKTQMEVEGGGESQAER